MPEPDPQNRPLITLTERFDEYCRETERIVLRGIEHPRFELKRELSIARERLADRLDFVKLVQGLANSHDAGERFVIIGADQKERKFYDVQNAAEFDAANLSAILSKYLDPKPTFQVFNNVRTQNGNAYVILVLDQNQPRPIVTVTEGTADKKNHFRLGDIWIKKDTSLQLAARADLDQIYETHIKRRVDEEAESRARRRFDHFRETLGTAFTANPTPLVPSLELIVSSRGHLEKFAESSISSGNITNIKMFLEMARGPLVEELSALRPDDSTGHIDARAWIQAKSTAYTDRFIPALDTIVDLGLQFIRFDVPTEWLDFLVNGLLESFEACREVDRRRVGLLGGSSGELDFARPAYDVYVGLRTLATYAVMRKRFKFLSVMLPRYVRMFTSEHQSKTFVPILFWPFAGIAGLPDMRDGRNQSFWLAHIQSAWGQLFGSFGSFLDAACQLEFILEFNSYIFFLPSSQDARIQKIAANKNFTYLPDFWRNRLDPVVPLAEHFYDLLASDQGFPADLSIEKSAISITLEGKLAPDRLLFLGGFLSDLKGSQERMMWENHRAPFLFGWEGRLKDITEKYIQAQKKKVT